MKLKTLYLDFELIQKVYNKLSYQRIFQLKSAYNEVKDQIQEIETWRGEIKKKHADKSGNIPEDKISMANDEFNRLLETDIELERTLRFTQKDIEQSGTLDGLEIIQLSDSGFIAENE